MKYIARIFGKHTSYRQCDYTLVEGYKLFGKLYYWKHTTINEQYKNFKIKL